MRRVNAVAATAAVAIGLFTGPVRADVTAFEGARLILGNGSIVENGTLADAGTLEAGKSADFIVLDANPLDDITNTRKISSVILRGVAVDRSQPVP